MSSNKRKLITFLSILFLTLSNRSFSQQISYSTQIPVEQFRIDIDYALGENVQNIITDLEYIPLSGNNSKELIQGIFKIEMLSETLGFLCFNDDKSFLFIYRHNGKLVKVIDVMCQSKIPKSESIFGMKQWDNQFVLSTENYKIMIDDIGENILTIKHEYEHSDSVRINSSIWKYFNYDDDISLPIPALTLNDNTVIQYEKGRKYNDYYNESYFSQMNKITMLGYFSIPNHKKIFELSKNGVEKIYDFIFPMKNIIDTSLVYSEEELLRRQMSSSIISNLDNLLSHEDFIIFNSGLVSNTFAFNLKNKGLLKFESIIPDSSNDFLPILSNQKIFTDGTSLYTLINPFHVREAEQKCKEEKHIMRKEYARLKNHKNPILVKFKLK